MAHMLSKDLKEAVLEYALLGKLTSQNSDEKVNEIVCQANERFKKSKLKNKVENLLTDELDELPVNWQWIQLGKVADIVRGLTFSTAFKEPVNNTTLVLRGGNIDSSTEKINFIDNIFVDSSIIKTEQYIKRDDTLIVASSGTKSSVGKSTLITEDYSNVSFGGFMMVVRPIGYLHPKLLSWHIKRYRQKIISNTVGYISNITLPILANLAIPLPPLEEQQRIVDKVEELMAKIDEYEKIENQLVKLKEEFPGDMKAAILQAAFKGDLTHRLKTDTPVESILLNIHNEKQRLIKEKTLKKEQLLPIINADEAMYEIPEEWQWVRIGDVVDCASGSTPLKANSDYYNNGTIPWLLTGDLNNGYIVECKNKITKKALDECSFRINKPNDILIAMYGATIGKLGICTFELVTNQACLGCTPFTGLDFKYLFYYFMAAKNELIGKAEGGAQPNISRIKVRNQLMPLPPIEEQQRIIELLDKLLPLCEKLI